VLQLEGDTDTGAGRYRSCPIKRTDRQKLPKIGTGGFRGSTECHVIIALVKLVRHRGLRRLGTRETGYEALLCPKTGVSEHFQHQHNPPIPPIFSSN
jgi:hypothetical protein